MQDQGDWRHRIGTILMAAAIVFFLSSWLQPLPETTSGLVSAAYYGGGLVILGVGWWLRRDRGRDA